MSISARRLAPLRERGVMILPAATWSTTCAASSGTSPTPASTGRERFDDAVVDQLAADPGEILQLAEHPDYALAVPTPDHFIPLLYIAGLAAAAGEPMEPLVRGYAMGSLSMTCYGLGADVGCEDGEGAATIPEGVPPEQTNI